MTDTQSKVVFLIEVASFNFCHKYTKAQLIVNQHFAS
jgi:hypothetical protein